MLETDSGNHAGLRKFEEEKVIHLAFFRTTFIVVLNIVELVTHVLLSSPADLDTSQDTDEEAVGGGVRQRTLSQRSDTSRASLHETILADKYDLDFKERRLAKRKRWLKQHQHLLRTLASYCILQVEIF